MSEVMNSVKKLWDRPKLNSARVCSQDRRLQWLGHLEGMQENT